MLVRSAATHLANASTKLPHKNFSNSWCEYLVKLCLHNITLGLAVEILVQGHNMA
jgi:hypothetical protein